MKLNGTDGKVKIGNITVAEINKWDLSDSVNKVLGRAFGETLEKAAAGARTVTGSIAGFFDPSDTNGQATMVVGAKFALNLYLSGDSSGDKYYQITEVLIESVQTGAENDQYVPFSANFHCNAVPTLETVA